MQVGDDIATTEQPLVVQERDPTSDQQARINSTSEGLMRNLAMLITNLCHGGQWSGRATTVYKGQEFSIMMG